MKKEKKYAVCSFCGHRIDADAAACTECGSDDRTGWSDSTYMDGIDLPADDSEYDELAEKEFGGVQKSPDLKKSLQGAIALILIALFAFFLLRQLMG